MKEKRLKYKDKKWLKEQYIQKKRSGTDIANLVDVTSRTIYNWLDRFNIPRRKSIYYQKRTHDEFVKKVKKISNDEYKVLGTYENANTKILLKHNECEHKWKITPNAFIHQDQRCPDCNLQNKKSQEEFERQLKKKYGDQYTVLGQYVNAKTKIPMRHNKCGYEWKANPNTLLRRKTCPYCGRRRTIEGRKKTHKEFIQEVKELVGEDYSVLEKYNGAKDKILMLHHKCNNKFKMTPSDFISGSRCPKCQKSKGEKQIKKYLDNNNIDYKPQFRINECKNKRPLPFDFAIFKDKNLKYLVEYQGRQHYEPIEVFGGKEGLKQRQKHDKIKRKFCEKNEIILIEIKYAQKENIKDILNTKQIKGDRI